MLAAIALLALFGTAIGQQFAQNDYQRSYQGYQNYEQPGVRLPQ